jgi:hypothetical protein
MKLAASPRLRTASVVAAVAAVAAVAVVALTACSGRGCNRGAAPSASAAAPAVVASATVGEAPVLQTERRVLLVDSGRAVVVEKDGVASYDASGKRTWHRAMRANGWAVLLPDGSALVNDRTLGDLVALDAATGQDRFRVPVPRLREETDKDAPPESPKEAAAATRLGDGALVALEDGRFLRVDPSQCAPKPGSGCVTAAFTLPDEHIGLARLDVTPSGDVVLAEHGAFRLLSATGETRAAFHVRDTLPDVARGSGARIAVAMDDELVLWDAARCAGTTPVALPRKAGRLHLKGEGDCDDCRAAPAGCLVARPKLGDVKSVPILRPDGSWVAADDDGLVGLSPKGETMWKKELHVYGDLASTDGEILALASDDGYPLLGPSRVRVVGVDPANGDVRWSQRLPTAIDAGIWGTDVVLEVNGPWIVAGYRTALTWLKRP